MLYSYVGHVICLSRACVSDHKGNRVLCKLVYLMPEKQLQHTDTGLSDFCTPATQVESASRHIPDSKVHGANMGPPWVLSASDGPHVDPMNLAVGDDTIWSLITASNITRYCVHNTSHEGISELKPQMLLHTCRLTMICLLWVFWRHSPLWFINVD